jgi:hypothetical protein
MSAAAIAAALGDARRDGRAWRCRCPLHGGRSLVLRDGDNGRAGGICADYRLRHLGDAFSRSEARELGFIDQDRDR